MKSIMLALRKLKRGKTATTLGLSGLITGLLCVLYIFFWINDEINYDRFHKNIDRIFVVHAYLEGGSKAVTFNGCPPAVALALKTEYPEVENTCRYIPAYSKSLITADGKKNLMKVAYSDNALFDIFSFPFIYGGPGEPNISNQIVLARTASLIFFGNSNPVGKMIRFNNMKDFIVTGVIDDIPHNSSLQFDAVIPIDNLKSFYGREDYLSTWYNNAFITFGLLSESAGFDKVASMVTKRIQKDLPESTNFLRAYLFKNGYLYEQKHIRNVKIFSLIALFVLLASILNFINLITARSIKQAKETGLRKSIGATRGNIIRLIYSDIAILCLIAFILALGIALLGLPIFNQAIGKQIDYSALFSLRLIGILILIYSITTFLAGSYPAFFLSSFCITETLSSNFHSVKKRGNFRNLLLITVFMVSIILFTATLVIYKQTLFLQNMKVGFNKEQLIYFNLEGKLKDKTKTLKEEVGRIVGVSNSTVTDFLPVIIGNNGEGWSWEGKDVNFKPLVTNWRTDEDMLETLEPQMIEGNYFSYDRQGIVINKALADMIGWKTFVGKTLNNGGQNYSIVGVIDNIQYNSLSESCKPMAIFPIDQWRSNYLIVRINSAHINKTVQSICKIFESNEPDFPVNYGFISDEFASLYEAETTLKKLVGIFAVFSLVVLCLGLWGVIIFLAEQKTKEIGVRKCLGEHQFSIVIHLVKPFLIAGLVAFIIATPITWYVMHLWLENFSNKTPLSWWIFALSGILALGIALFAVSWQSWKAATRNPVEALRYE